MMIYFADRDLNILGNASTQLPDGFRICDDLTVEEIDTGVNTFSCVLPYTQDDRADLEPMVAEGNYILKQSARGDDDNAYDSVYQIIEVECDTESQEYSIYAEDAGLDLLNTLCPAVTLTGNIGQMMNYFLPNDWSLNLMDVPTTSRTYTWDGESTCTERLLSVANLWGCELYYSFVIDRLQIEDRVVNVIEKRGNQEAIPQLRLNFDLKKIYWKKSIAELVTALSVTGGTPEGQDNPITLVGYNYSYTDPSTGEVYRVDTATGQMRNVTAMAKWSSAIDPDGLWVGSFQFDTTDKATLAGQARAYLQRHSQVEVNYEVDFEKLPEDIQIGDRVNIIDEDGELYLEARLLRIETCEAEDTQTATIGEYLLRSGGISARVAQLASDLANARATDKVIQSQMQIITDTVDNMFTLEVDSDVVLAQAHLTARLLQGNKDIKTDYDPSWFKWILRSENGERLLGRGYTYTADMNIIGYASTILCRFIRPQLYDLTDHNLVAITDANLDPIQVSFAGLYNQPVVTRNLLKSKLKTLRATSTVEVGDPNLTREVNLYERNGFADSVALFTGNKGGYVVLKPNEDGQPEEILVMDTPDIETAVNVWRWNKEGIGYSADGYNGTYSTAWTIDGTFVADFIKAGIISDVNGNTTWDMATGLLNMTKGAINLGGKFIVNDSGYLQAVSGLIAGWVIQNNQLYAEDTDGTDQNSMSVAPNSLRTVSNQIVNGSRHNLIAEIKHGELYAYYDSTLLSRYGATYDNSYNPCTGIGCYKAFALVPSAGGFIGYRFGGGEGAGSYGAMHLFQGSVKCANSFTVSGTKSRQVDTKNYQDRLLYCYETPTPLFGDIGEAVIDEDGYCYVDLDDIFTETIATKVEYQVFLQKEGEGDCFIAEKNPTYFVIQGTPNMKVAWELKAKQRDYELIRLEQPQDEEEYVITDGFELLDDYITEQESILYGNY